MFLQPLAHLTLASGRFPPVTAAPRCSLLAAQLASQHHQHHPTHPRRRYNPAPSTCRSLNAIHVAAALTKMAGMRRSKGNSSSTAAEHCGPSSAAPARDTLMSTLQALLVAQACRGHSPRSLANIIWALAKLQCAPVPYTHLTLPTNRKVYNPWVAET